MIDKINYCKISVIRAGHIYGKRTDLMDLYLGEGGEGICIYTERGEISLGGKNTSICNLLNLLLFPV